MTAATRPDSATDTATAHAELDEFRVHSAPEVAGYLRELSESQLRVLLSTPDGQTLHTMICALDAPRGVLGFDIPGENSQVRALLGSDEVVGVAFLDAIKLQFDLEGLVIVKDKSGPVLRAQLPRRMYRFQRRQAFRVQPTGLNFPRVALRHPSLPDMLLNLRVLDISMGGLALLLPEDVPEIEGGIELAGALIELDRDTRFELSLRLQHVAPMGEGHSGSRLGCAFVSLPPSASRELQIYIDQTQKRRRMMKL
ncbi:flagellar regulator YcgR PilZN domain-containing protein [Paucibacter sp. APW11]|uniref:Flagellar brake protein YcgR n=1 Tax=Roseateles aquae TaxID=3077235 RepID=A0ABU3PAU3_9BURK|nr:flagellar regulator YcgR PilZN domain-containing protein [Paucibacter sp. APW11]MDT8999345.1 flagellar regulator YcgR PilZN domain-containing protein [Paucibacter sp. APW11]